MRYLVALLHERLTGPSAVAYGSFPWATFAVNVIGCLLIGLFTGIAASGHLPAQWKLVLITGFCGGFTTFSTFMNDNLLMARDGQMLAALLYTVLSMVLGMAAVVAGYQVVK